MRRMIACLHFVLFKQRLECISGHMATIESFADPDSVSSLRASLSKIANWIGNKRSIRVLEVGSLVALLAMAVFTISFLSGQNAQSEPMAPAMAAALLVANLLPATTLIVLIGRRVALQRSKLVSVGSKELMHVRLVAIFSLISAIPTLLMVIFASILFQSGVQFWFSSSARDMLSNAGQLAKGYYEEKLRDVGDETETMAGDLRYALNQTRPDDPAFLGNYVDQVLRRKFSESAIVTVGADGVQRTSAVVSPDESPNKQWIPKKTLVELQSGQSIVVSALPNRIEAIMILYENPKSYLYTSRATTVPSFELGGKAQSVLKDYEAMVARSRNLQIKFNIALYFVSLLIIGITVWVALVMADRLVRPINKLVNAAQKIAGGDMSARVSGQADRNDEVGFLSQSFNRMTERLQNQTDTLIAANQQLHDRRVFIEAVLESVTAGIVSIESNGNIQLANSTAEKLLGNQDGTIVGKQIKSLSSTFHDLIQQGQYKAVVQIGENAEPQTVAVKISEREGAHVLTFEDISQQLSDQRRAAWSDVARRIAHEIKNPLTPIQLAAERLQRRFGKQIGDGSAVFEQLTGTIIRQVGDLRNIVDEFSSFARMPKPVLREENLVDIVAHAVFLMEVAHSKIKFVLNKPAEFSLLVCDRRQLGQAFTNILKNAVESIYEQENQILAADFAGHIEVCLMETQTEIHVSISDNGTGLPADRDRILEPYITSRSSGSGLGLAIVKKIVEEHCAEIRFSDAQNGGAKVTIIFAKNTTQVLALSQQQKGGRDAVNPLIKTGIEN